MNPFFYQNVCYGDNFCSRDNEFEKINNFLQTKTNILIYSKRRFGKTSLIKEYFKHIIDKDRIYRFI
jgi:AAA+ ATPase superfamily predicted ATPase